MRINEQISKGLMKINYLIILFMIFYQEIKKDCITYSD